MLEVILKRFEQPNEVRTFEKGKFEVVRLGGMSIGRATYEPGWTLPAAAGGCDICVYFRLCLDPGAEKQSPGML
jgi:hypothetical protein